MRFNPTEGDAFSDEIIILQSGTFSIKRAMAGKRLRREISEIIDSSVIWPNKRLPDMQVITISIPDCE